MKRFISLLIVFCLVILLFSFTVYADDSSPIQIRYQIQNLDGTWDDTIYTRPLNQGFFVNNGIRGFRIVGFYLRPVSFNAQEEWLVSFRVTGYSYTDNFQLSIPTSSHTFLGTGNPSTIKYFIARQYYSGGPGDIYQNDASTQLLPSGNSSTVQLQFSFNSFNDATHENYSTITLASPISFSMNKNSYYWPYLYDIYTEQASQLQFSFYNAGVVFFAASLNSLNSILAECSRFSTLFNSSYNYVKITYNSQTGELEQQNMTGTYWEALLGSITSLSADSQAQIDQQEKAREKGAEDALDEGYDKSDFWSLIDFFDIADMGDYDDDILEDVADDGPLAWFSQTTKDDLDTVERSRDFDDNFIDFYELNLQEIEDILSGDRAERNGYK